jgi:hypothetical protein
MMRSFLAAVFLMISLSVNVLSAAGAAPPDPPCGTIPFGSTIEEARAFYLPAVVGTWDAGDALVFLMAANSPEGPLLPEVMTVPAPALKRYLEICKTC